MEACGQMAAGFHFKKIFKNGVDNPKNHAIINTNLITSIETFRTAFAGLKAEDTLENPGLRRVPKVQGVARCHAESLRQKDRMKNRFALSFMGKVELT